MPTPYAATDDLIRFAPADPLLADLDGDGVQDLALGRLPARTGAELDLLIDKTLQFDGKSVQALFAADRSSTGSFSALSDQLIGLLPAGWGAERAYVDELGAAAARQTLLAGFEAGPALVSFVGHSGPTSWSFEGLFSSSDADALGNTGDPSLVIQWGCWNTYHVAPQYDTLAHRLLLAGPQGAAAVLGSSTLSKESSDSLLGPAVVRELSMPGTRLGDAILRAKRSIAGQGDAVRDVLIGWTLLGDPALTLAP